MKSTAGFPVTVCSKALLSHISLIHFEKMVFIEMDDFGTGESSLSMVAEMPVDLLKLGRSFLGSGRSFS